MQPKRIVVVHLERECVCDCNKLINTQTHGEVNQADLELATHDYASDRSKPECV